MTVNALRQCKLSIVAVGGGGGAGSDFGGYGGGGSGYVKRQDIQILGAGTNNFRVKVGAGGKRGKNGKDTTIDWGLTAPYYTAKGGQKGEGVSGGAGYSGGGSDGDGGSDGAEGCCGSASSEGSGLDLSSISLKTLHSVQGLRGRNS